jgi:hypothetical protein
MINELSGLKRSLEIRNGKIIKFNLFRDGQKIKNSEHVLSFSDMYEIIKNKFK